METTIPNFSLLLHLDKVKVFSDSIYAKARGRSQVS